MRKGSTDKSLDNFEEWMGSYIGFLDRVLAARVIVRTVDEKREFTEAFVLRIASLWEILVETLLVETLLIDCLNRDTSALARHTGLPLKRHLTRPVCEAIVSGLHYFDVKSVSDLRGLAKKILVLKHNPFRAIPKDAERKIDQFFAFRNYLAHYSSESKRRVRRVYENSYGLKKFQEPGAFLYAARGRGGQIRLGDYVDAFLEASAELRKAC